MLVDRRVHIVDVDPASMAHAARVLRSAGYDVHTHASASHFVRSQPDRNPGCVLLDIRLPEPDGLAIQEQLIASGMIMPMILFTGDDDMELASRAMRAGSLHFLEKPYDDEDLIAMVAEAFERLVATEIDTVRKAAAVARLALLTPREVQVMERLVSGMPNKLIAHDLGLSIRTVEMHRLRMMDKLQARSLVAVFRLWVDANRDAPAGALVELPSTLEATIAS